MSNGLQAVGRKLDDADVVPAVRDIHSIVVVNQDAQIIVALVDGRLSSPFPSWVCRGEDIRFPFLDATIPVEQTIALAVLHGTGPDTTDIRLAATVEVVLVTKRKLGDRMADELPVNQVVRLEHRGTGGVVHGRCGVVVRVVDADDFEICEIFPENRVVESGLGRDDRGRQED